MDELKLLNEIFDKLEADIAVTRNANSSLLSSCLVETERQCWVNALYSRREDLEIYGLPKSFTIDKVETRVCQIFQSLDCNISKGDLDACHWLRNMELVIVKFCRKKDFKKVLKAKKD